MAADGIETGMFNEPARHPVSGTPLPGSVFARARQALQDYRSRASAEQSQWLTGQLENCSFYEELALVWGCSPFVADNCARYPDLFQNLVASGDLDRPYLPGHLLEQLRAGLAAVGNEAELQRLLRRARRRELMRIVWRDFCRKGTLMQTTGDVTALAEACIKVSLDYLHPAACAEWGTPMAADSETAQELVVIGMGKLGAWELNVSSDIDLIFAYPENGQTQGGRRQLSNQEFFTRLGQKLIQSLDAPTADGLVFRVDMRLRPYGQSGALAMSFGALEEYYTAQGRDWERYAMVKARVVAGSATDARRLMAILRPFTYRRYIDYSAIESLRDMKAMINRDVARLGGARDIKRGAGGIREVEFIAQAFQLIRGGKDRRFQDPRLENILALLGQEGLLPIEATQDLWRAYVFLRDTEHGIQGMRDQQSQRLPGQALEQEMLATAMAYPDWHAFDRDLQMHTAAVHAVFGDLANAPDKQNETARLPAAARSAWLEHDGDEARRLAALQQALTGLGFQQVDAVAGQIETFRNGKSVQAMARDVRKRLDTFMPMLLAACGQVDGSDRALSRAMGLVEAIARRSAYLVLLIENPGALDQLVRLCADSLWIAQQLTAYPALLDELLHVQNLYSPPDKNQLRGDLRQQVLRVDADDLDAQMEGLRYFRRAHALQVAASEVMGVLPVMRVSDYLTWLAEVILEHVLALAWEQMVQRYGQPGSNGPPPGFLVVGYGKLGGIELGHGSDLDLVFLHNADLNLETDGEHPIDNVTFFTRLGQRIIHILATRTLSGSLYEVDMRLRPSGNSGLLVSSINAFRTYQLEKAWTWEHQALVRARPVAGDAGLAREFEALRIEVLCRQRQREKLRQDVIEMRRKMRDHLGSRRAAGNEEQFQLKQDAGGIVDIEFMVQFAVLAMAHDFPDITRWTDNIRILDSLEACAVMSREEAENLREAYKLLRAAGHRLQLQEQPDIVPAADYVCPRQAVATVWQRLLQENQ